MSEHLDRCSWKLVDPSKFVMGISADRCGAIADVVVLRPNRKTDLFLCEEHINEFIAHWGLHNKVQILCRCVEDPAPAALIADPALLTDYISSGSKVPKKLPEPAYPLEWSDICRHGRPECECGGAR